MANKSKNNANLSVTFGVSNYLPSSHLNLAELNVKNELIVSGLGVKVGEKIRESGKGKEKNKQTNKNPTQLQTKPNPTKPKRETEDWAETGQEVHQGHAHK